MTDDTDRTGLYSRYEVHDEDGETVEDCFVLEPESDVAAREALRAYADATDDGELSQDLREWLRRRPDEWPETFSDPSLGCNHAFTWDTADGRYVCMYCGETRDEPPEQYVEAETDGGERDV